MVRRLFLWGFVAFCLSGMALSDDTEPLEVTPDLAQALQFYATGNFGAAEQKFGAILAKQPGLVAAQAGLIRSLLRQEKVTEAFTTATNALAKQPDSAVLLAVTGEVEFRRGEIHDAEVNFVKALKFDKHEVFAYIGLARLYDRLCYYRHGYDALNVAHQLAPDNPEVQKLWFARLPIRERITAIEAYLSKEHPDDPEETQRLQQTLQYLKAVIQQPVHACRLVSKIESTEMKLEPPPTSNRKTHYDVVVKLNDRKSRLQLDTGASGLVLDRKAAEKAGLQKIADIRMSGVGDRGSQGGFTAVANHIQIGELEFEDCVVAVADKMHALMDEDGLLGTDIFRSYLVDIDMPAQKLRLSLLPKRPDEPAVPITLGSAENRSATQGQPPSANGPQPSPPQSSPKDRYVSPEMASWLPIARVGHQLFIPTRVNDSKPMLFIIDTGSSENFLSSAAAKGVTNLIPDLTQQEVRGLSGAVDRTYRAKAKLQVGNLAYDVPHLITTFDLTGFSKALGIEISGFLGFDLLSELDTKVDYRDCLVDFTYNRKH
jgi:predicted aspartyl protease